VVSASTVTSTTKPIAQAGLFAKGVVYCLLGLLAFMAAFHLGGQSVKKADTAGVFDFVYQQAGGQIMLAVIAAGLFCYCIWRAIQAFGDSDHKGNDSKGLAARGRYLASGLVYASLAVYAVSMLFSGSPDRGDPKQGFADQLLSRPFGQYLVAIAAAVLLGIGIYQIYYGLSEKYRKHVYRAGSGNYKDLLLTAGKVGYVARGAVWLLIAWLFFKASLNTNSAEAGDTGKAFGFLQEVTYGPYLVAAIGLGLICYGTFNFVRARYESF
jgi:hypothetical protein